MRKLFNYMLIVVLAAFYACSDMNDMHQEYLDQGEQIYLGKVDSIKVFPGDKKVKFRWIVTADPRVKKGTIYWNNRKDSSLFTISRTSNNAFYQEVTVNPVTEGAKVFQIVTKDDLGNKSLPAEVSSDVYGDNYRNQVSNFRSRGISAMEALSPSEVLLYWKPLDDPAINKMLINYTSYAKNPAGEPASIDVLASETQTKLTGVKLKDRFIVQNLYLPSTTAIDVFPGKATEFTLPAVLLPGPGVYTALATSYGDYGLHGWAVKDLTDATYIVEIDGAANKFRTQLGFEGAAWAVGFEINEDYTIKVYGAKINSGWTLRLTYDPAQNYFDPITKTIYVQYWFTVPKGWPDGPNDWAKFKLVLKK